MQELIDNERPKKQPKADGELNWTDYHSFEDIYDWLDALESEFPQFVTVEEIGRTYEGRPFKLVKLSKQQVIQITTVACRKFGSFIAEQSRDFYRSEHPRSRVDCIGHGDLHSERVAAL